MLNTTHFASLSDAKALFSSNNLSIVPAHKNRVAKTTETFIGLVTDAFEGMATGPVLDGVIGNLWIAYSGQVGGYCIAPKAGNA